MAQRRPKIKPIQNPASTTPKRTGRGGRSIVTPTQTRISYSDLQEVTSPAGIAKLNDEIRRIALAQKAPDIQDIIAAIPAATVTPGGDLGGEVGAFAQSYFDDGVFVVGDQVAKVNFIDSNTVKFVLTDKTSNGVQAVDIQAEAVGGLSIIVGDVLVNRLPLDPAARPSPDSVLNDYLYEMYDYTPDNGYYGWYCYGVINHNLGLANKNDYILNIVDKQIIDDRDLNDLESEAYKARFAKMITEPYGEGIDGDRLILRAIFKPDLAYYAGSMGTQYLDYVDEDARILRTNIIFRYTMIGT